MRLRINRGREKVEDDDTKGEEQEKLSVEESKEREQYYENLTRQFWGVTRVDIPTDSESLPFGVDEAAAAQAHLFNEWLYCPCPRPDAKLRLLCFPWAGGTSQYFREWHFHLPAAIEVMAVKLPGRLDRLRSTMVADMDFLVIEIVEALTGLGVLTCQGPSFGAVSSRPNLHSKAIPVALFGHELGAVVAFEVARKLQYSIELEKAETPWELQQQSSSPSSSSFPIHLRAARSPTTSSAPAKKLTTTTTTVTVLFVSGICPPQMSHSRLKLSTICQVDSQSGAILHALNENFEKTLRKRGGMPEQLFQNKELLRIFVPQLLKDLSLLDGYEYKNGRRLTCPIVSMSGALDSVVVEALDCWNMESHSRESQSLLMPGDQFYLRDPEGEQDLLEVLRRKLGAALEELARVDEEEAVRGKSGLTARHTVTHRREQCFEEEGERAQEEEAGERRACALAGNEDKADDDDDDDDDGGWVDDGHYPTILRKRAEEENDEDQVWDKMYP